MDREREFDDTNGQTISISKAAKFNAHTLRKLQTAVSHDPEIDLTTQMLIYYTGRLIRMQTSKEVLDMSNNGFQRSTKPKEKEIRESLNPSDTVHILFPLSREVLRLVEDISKTAEPLPNGLSQ
ncbi:uncharacterized protein EURHEDRAFT_405476 [Aspergillus ruber CBS 135680]|uniref:Uncharacterized protein n=1 Tax=Aspergillus ruber (strain CBS 135680) TaxID=1388766 RepID=A0A017S588_ASPRC|nr:uncharacterized protein EURHEDRAFT_405476 [Aspergillus ruber CBS 135680]EYE92092.1 hypothetical protein EURHEDRAFT_405476 [Aspergillus ruber CBS 135680]